MLISTCPYSQHLPCSFILFVSQTFLLGSLCAWSSESFRISFSEVLLVTSSLSPFKSYFIFIEPRILDWQLIESNMSRGLGFPFCCSEVRCKCIHWAFKNHLSFFSVPLRSFSLTLLFGKFTTMSRFTF